MHAHHGGVARDFERFAEAVYHQREPIAANAAEGVGEAETLMTFAAVIRAFDDVGIHAETVLRQHCRENAGAHPVSDVKRLAHRADVLAHTAAGRRHNAHRHAGLKHAQPQQPARGDRHALPADDADRVPAVVDQRGAQSFGDA